MKFVPVAALAALAFAAGAQAQNQSQVILMGDTGMSCRDVISAANEQGEILGGVPEAGLFASEAAINSMTGLAMEGALRSGAADAIPGIGAVGGLFGRAARARAEQEEARRTGRGAPPDRGTPLVLPQRALPGPRLRQCPAPRGRDGRRSDPG